MKYDFPELVKREQAEPGIIQTMLSKGVLHSGNMILETPEDGQTLKGLGDLIAVVAKPIARMAGIKDCGDCKKRQTMLNGVFPFKKTTLDNHKQSANSPNSVT